MNKNIKKAWLIAISFLILGVGIFSFFLSKTTKSKFDCEYKNRFKGYVFYLAFPFNKNLKIPNEELPPQCLYEFYEGLYEISSLTNHSDQNLDNVCAYINTKLPKRTWDQCNFRIGIAMTYTKRAQIYGADQLERMVDSKLKFCDGLITRSFDCIIGVYTGVNVAYQNHEKDSRFPIVDGDPFWICKIGRGWQHKLQCMRNIVSFIYDFTDYDINRGVELVSSNLSDPAERFELLVTYFSSLAFRREIPQSKIQEMCTTFTNKEVRQACVEGYANGLVEASSPGHETEVVLEYCLTPLYSYNESGRCLSRGFSDLPISNIKEHCLSKVPIGYKVFCNKVGEDFELPFGLRLNK